MNQNGSEHLKSRTAPDHSFFTALGRAAQEDMLRECDLWERESGDVTIPDKVESQILELARKHEKKQLNKKRNRYIRRYTKTAAAIVLLVTVSFTALIINADAWRGKVFSFIFQDSDAYMKIIPVETGDPDENAQSNLPADWEDVYYPDYLPEGYQFAEAAAAGSARTISFQNDGDILILSQEPSEGAEVLIDKEGTENGETEVQGSTAFWSSKGGETTLMWNEYGLLFMLYGPMDLNELKKVAEHLLYME
jgi:hypothetical protein